MSAQEIQEQLHLILQTLDFRASLDILLLAAGFVLIYRTFRPSGGLKIVAAVLGGTVLFGLSRLFQFRALGWIFENFRDVIIILLVVVFQPEIRRMFEKVASLRRRRLRREPPGFPAAFAATVFRLAQNRSGALFVFPGNDNTLPYTTGGFPARAAYSDALIQSIFDHHSPGHDGAVLIEGDRVQAFGLRLPLSESGGLPDELGTRHHAAMGLAEKTDALVLAVSEERGSVTLFQNGVYRQIGDVTGLEAVIQEYFARGKTPRPFQRFVPLALQSACALGLAFVFWSAVVFSDGRIRRVNLEVPVEFAGRPGGLVLADGRNESVRLQISGNRESLRSLNDESLKFRLDLSGRGPGRHLLPLRASGLDLPAGLKLLQAEPAALPVSLVAITEKTARVDVRFTGKSPPGLELLVSEIQPDLVSIYFNRDKVGAGAPVIFTRPIDVSKITESTTRRVKLDPPGDMRPVEGVWPEVTVSLEVVPRGPEPAPPPTPPGDVAPDGPDRPPDEPEDGAPPPSG